MFAIIIATHGNLANELLTTAAMIYGDQADVLTVTLANNDGLASLKAKFSDRLAKLANKEVLILTDLWGGSPFNVAAEFAGSDPERIELVAGVNLPMILEAYTLRNQPLAKVMPTIVSRGQEAVKQLKLVDDTGDDLL